MPGEREAPVKKTLPAQAVKIRKEFQDIPLTIVQEYRQFFDNVWNLCGAIIEARNKKPRDYAADRRR
jgi:hypothetical protein